VDLLKPPECPEELRRLSRFTWIKEVEGSYHLGLMNSNMLSIRENGLGQCDVYRHVKGIRTKLYVAKDLKRPSPWPRRKSGRRPEGHGGGRGMEERTTDREAGWPVVDPGPKAEAGVSDAAKTSTYSPFRDSLRGLSFSRGLVSNRIDSLRSAQELGFLIRLIVSSLKAFLERDFCITDTCDSCSSRLDPWLCGSSPPTPRPPVLTARD